MASGSGKVHSSENFTFSIDLITQAVYQLEFFAVIDENPSLQTSEILTRVLYRYEKFWLPLAAAHPYECLSSPIDTEWLWHCHKLSPKACVRDCLSVVGKTIDHTLSKVKVYKKTLKKPETLWHRLYPTEPFHTDYTQAHHLRFQSRIHYNIIDAAMLWFGFCFTALQHILGHFERGQLPLPHCSWASLLGSLPVLSGVHSFASN